MIYRCVALLSVVFTTLGATTQADDSQDGRFPVASNLRAGVAKVDITPDVSQGLNVVGHRRKVFKIRDPLRAGVLVLDDGETKAAIVTLDTIGAWDEMVLLARERIQQLTDIPASNIMVTASHNHSGPGFDRESAWGRELIDKLGVAAKNATATMRPVSIGYDEDQIGFSINRRKVIDGRAVVRLNPEGPNDQRVKVLRFDDGSSLTPLAVVMHAVCHPCFFTWGDKGTTPYPNGYPKLSADFPGEAQSFVEMVYGDKTSSLFLQGCAGDIRPNLPGYPYRCADEADIQWAGRDLGSAVVRSLARGVTREKLKNRNSYYAIRVASAKVSLPGKEGRVTAELMAMKIGPYLLLTMPGEPMVEYGFRLEQAIEDRAIPIIVGYANGNIGYIATAAAYDVGGYEPNTSKLLPEAETIILDELGQLADRVIGDVFESFSKHPKDVKRREEREKSKKSAGR
ncbi:MAG: neutral ceramidase [Porticoccaceae bacterium]|jgi:neutral ceramidase